LGFKSFSDKYCRVKLGEYGDIGHFQTNMVRFWTLSDSVVGQEPRAEEPKLKSLPEPELEHA
jgi:hypothetical protein